MKNLIEMYERNMDVLFSVKEMKTLKVELLFVNDYPEEVIEDDILSHKLSVRVITNPQNQGIHQTRVNGLNEANGRYIQFLDQDDTVTDDYLLTQIQSIGMADVVLCNGIWRENKRIYKDLEEHILATQKEGYYPQNTWLVSPGQLLIKKSFIPKEWKRYILRESGSDDALLWLLILRDTKKIAINPQITYFHNEDGENTSFNFKKMSRSIKEMMYIIENHISFDKSDFEILKKGQNIRIARYDAYAKLEEMWDSIIEGVKCILSDARGKKAIYGYGIIGKKLLKDLKTVGCDIDIIIDKDAENYMHKEKMYYTLETVCEDIDVVIVTPIFDKEKLIVNLKKNTYLKRIIMIDEV